MPLDLASAVAKLRHSGSSMEGIFNSLMSRKRKVLLAIDLNADSCSFKTCR